MSLAMWTSTQVTHAGKPVRVIQGSWATAWLRPMVASMPGSS